MVGRDLAHGLGVEAFQDGARSSPLGPPYLGPPSGPRHRPTVRYQGEAVSCERGHPVRSSVDLAHGLGVEAFQDGARHSPKPVGSQAVTRLHSLTWVLISQSGVFWPLLVRELLATSGAYRMQ